MLRPKLLRILDTVAARLQVIARADGYYTDIGCSIRLDKREPHLDDMPCCLVYLSDGVAGQVQNQRQRVEQSITVVGFVSRDAREAEEVGIELLADIQRAVELEDAALSSLLLNVAYGLTPQEFGVTLPESGVDAVAAFITYSAPYIRRSGDPEII